MRRRLALVFVAAVTTGACSWMDAINPFASSGPKMAELKPFTASAQARVVWN